MLHKTHAGAAISGDAAISMVAKNKGCWTTNQCGEWPSQNTNTLQSSYITIQVVIDKPAVNNQYHTPVHTHNLLCKARPLDVPCGGVPQKGQSGTRSRVQLPQCVAAHAEPGPSCMQSGGLLCAVMLILSSVMQLHTQCVHVHSASMYTVRRCTQCVHVHSTMLAPQPPAPTITTQQIMRQNKK